MHVQRLADDFVELDAHVPDRLAAAGVDPADAAAAGAFLYTVGADGSATLAPWPLGVPEVTETVVGYLADGYPQRLDPVERVFRLRPAA